MKLGQFPHRVLQLGLGGWAICYLLAAALFWLRADLPNPHQAILLYRSFLEAGPAFAAASVCAAFICDLVQKKGVS